ncbi:MAG: ATP-binding protein [Steroidobacter sp.]
MSDRKVKLFLFLTILIVSVLPLLAALYLLDRSLQTSLNLGFNPQVTMALEDSSRNLLVLKNLDPQRQAEYRQQFEHIERLRHVYSQPELIRRSLRDSLLIYFALGLTASVAFAVLLAAVLSRRIARAYTQTFDDLLAQREKVRYLQEISSWQELARMLAHEIKNPLTPIEVLVSSLRKAHEQLTPAQFSTRLVQTQAMIGEELQHLQQTVNKFADFARLPQVQPERVELVTVVRAQLKAIGAMFPSSRMVIDANGAVPADIDTTLVRQVLTNIVRNGVEAGAVNFDIRLSVSAESIELALCNDGPPVPTELIPRLFDPYVSSKTSKENMGLGLAIARKVVIDHGGDIRYQERRGRPEFVIQLPRGS